MIDIRGIDRAHQQDINLPNEPFPLFGRLVPTFDGTAWHYTAQYSPAGEMVFPEEHYSYAEMADNTTFLGAYQGDTCLGLAVVREGFQKYMYLYDLKVTASHRRQGIAGQLLSAAQELARQKGYIGVYTVGQDNNLAACLCYLSNGFRIGGFDNRVYDGTPQAGKGDIFFYKRHSL